MKKLKVAITGWNGFLGAYLPKSLKGEKVDIVCFDSKKNDLFAPETLKSFLENADIVVHLAGANRDTDYNLFRINTLGTVGLLEGMAKYSPKAKIIFSSSLQAYDEKSAYGLSKKLAEDAIRNFSEIYKVNSIILRIANIYGKGGKPFYNSVIATFLHLIGKNKTIEINGTGEQKRDYIYVEDVVSAIKKAVYSKSLKNCEVFDICSGKMISLNEIIKIFERLLSRKIEIKYNNKKAVGKELKGSYVKAKKYLMWVPKTSLEDGLRKILE